MNFIKLATVCKIDLVVLMYHAISQLRSCPVYSFTLNFGYLLFFRSMYLLGFDHYTGPTNAVQLVLTLKVWNYLLTISLYLPIYLSVYLCILLALSVCHTLSLLVFLYMLHHAWFVCLLFIDGVPRL